MLPNYFTKYLITSIKKGEVEMSVVEKLEEAILEIFITMQDRFRAVEKRQPIALIDALAITKQGHGYVLEKFVALEKACVIVPRNEEENKNYKAEAKASGLCKKIIREGKRKDTRTAKQLGFWQGYLQRGKELLGEEKTK